MIVDLPSTTTRQIARRLIKLRGDVGAMTIGRVMTLIAVTDEEHADQALASATEASRQHPSRIVVLVRGNARGAIRMDAQIRLGGDAGASEIVVARLHGELANHGDSVATPLLLADSPVVAWWPQGSSEDLANSPIGMMAIRRITDASQAANPRKQLLRRRATYANGDTDMAWSRTTRWRALLASALDLEPFESVTSIVVKGASDSASTDLLAGWLAVRLRAPARRVVGPSGVGLISVRLERASGPIELSRHSGSEATLTQPGQPKRRITLPRPGTAASLAEELRRLDKDPVYRDALLNGLDLVTTGRGKKTSASHTTTKES